LALSFQVDARERAEEGCGAAAHTFKPELEVVLISVDRRFHRVPSVFHISQPFSLTVVQLSPVVLISYFYRLGASMLGFSLFPTHSPSSWFHLEN
jgi:hypothetical protein